MLGIDGSFVKTVSKDLADDEERARAQQQCTSSSSSTFFFFVLHVLFPTSFILPSSREFILPFILIVRDSVILNL